MGRPRKIKQIEESAENLPGAEPIEVPGGVSESRPGGRRLPWDEFSRFVAGYSPKDDLSAYLYRLWPVIDNRLVDPNAYKYIDVLMGPAFSLDFIGKKWGRGTYKLHLVDGARKGSQQLVECVFEVDDPQLEPVFEHGGLELDRGHAKNKSFVQSLKLAGRLPDLAAPGAPAAAPAAVDTLARVVSESLQQRDRSPAPAGVRDVIEMARELNSTKSDPFDLAMRINEATRGGGGGGDSAVLKLLLDQNRMLMEQMLKRPAAPEAGGGLLDSLDVLERLEKRLGGRAVEDSMPGWVKGLIEAAAPMLPGLLAYLSRPAAAAPGAPAAAPGAPVVVAAPGAPVPAAAQVVDAAPANGGEMLAAKLMGIAGRGFTAFQKGVPGSAFAEGIVNTDEDGEQVYTFLMETGLETVLLYLKQHPRWSAEIAPRESSFRMWLADFLAYGENPDAGQDDPAGQAGEEA